MSGTHWLKRIGGALAVLAAGLLVTDARLTAFFPYEMPEPPPPETIDGDGPQFTIVTTPSVGLVTNKMGDTATFNVWVACNYGPCLTAQVSVIVSTSDDTQAVVKGPFSAFSDVTTLVYQYNNYAVPKTVTVKGVDDGQQLGDRPYTLTLRAASSDTRINGLTTTVTGVNQDRTDHNVCMPDVVDGFRSLPTNLHTLPIKADNPGLAQYDCGSTAGFNILCGKHIEGAARTKKGPYYVVTTVGPDASEFYVNKLAAKVGLDGRPWRTNAFTWENDLQVNYPNAYRISTTDKHAGGLSIFGDYAAIPLEGDSTGTLVYFYDMFDPEHPLKLSTELWQGYEFAGAAAVAKVNGRYLVAVMTNEPAEIQFFHSSTGDIRQPQSWSYKGGWSTQQHGYPSDCLGKPEWAPTIQNMNFIQQCDGKVFLAVTYNTGHTCNDGAGDNYVRVYEVDVPSIIAYNQREALTTRYERVFSCATDVYPYCNMAAGAGFFVSPTTRQLMMYASHYYSIVFPTSIGSHRFLLNAEFADDDNPPGHHVLLPRQVETGIENGKLFVGREGPDICFPLSRCSSEWVYSQSVRNVPLNDIHYVRVQFLPLTDWNATIPAPFAQVDDNVRARPGPLPWTHVFDVYPSPARDPDYGSALNAYYGTLRFVEQDDQGDNFGTPFYNGWPRTWKDWRTECSSKADGDEDKNGLGVRLWSSGTDLSPTSTDILRDVSVCIVDDSPGDISPAWRVAVKRKSENLPPALDPIPPRSVAEGSALSFSIHGTDINDDTVTYAATGLPAGATLNDITGAVAWAPTLAQEGLYNVTFTTTDGLASASQPAAITVTHVNAPPVLAPIGNRTAYKGTLFSLQLSASDPDGGAFDFSASPLPPGATINEDTGRFEWLLVGTSTYASSYTVTFRVTDPTGLSDSETIVIYVGTLTCLLAGTPVEMADGTLVPIEEVRPGDRVRSYDEARGEFVSARVSEVMTGTSAMHLVINGTLRATDKHPLRVNGSWVEAGEVKLGDILMRSDGTAEIVRSVDIVDGEEPVYNLEVEGTHTFCAGGRVVHNKPPVGGGGSQTGG